MAPCPDQAKPEITNGPELCLMGACGLGDVITDLASMTHVHFLDVPSAKVSVYLDVSSRLSIGWSVTSTRRNHFTHILPSHPGTTSRTGYPCSLRNASPFALKATNTSSRAFSIGIERPLDEASAPSTKTHDPSGFNPASLSKVRKGIPVYSILCIIPCVN